MTEDEIPFTQRLRNELMQAAYKHHGATHRRARRARKARRAGYAALAFVVGAVGTGTSFAYRKDSSAAILSITEAGDQLTVVLNQPSTSSGQVAEELSRRHVKAEVVLQPAAPAQVGRFLNLGTNREVGSLIPMPSIDGSFAGFSLTRTANSKITLYLGRKAEPAERYASAFDPFTPGGELHCAGIWGQPLAQATPVLRRAFSQVTLSSADNGDPNTAVVVGAAQLSNEFVAVVVAAQVSDAIARQRPDVRDC